MVPAYPAKNTRQRPLLMDRSSLVESRYKPLRPVKRLNGLGMYLSTDTLVEESEKDYDIWSNPDSWLGSLYFGSGDSRLYVPKRGEGGRPHAVRQTLNLSHKRGRFVAFRLLGIYFLSLAAAVVMLAFLLGYPL